MELKRHPKISVFFARFLEAFGNIDGTAGGLRGNYEEAAGTTLSPADTPRAAPYYQRILYNTKQRRGCLEDLARLRAVGSANFSRLFGNNLEKSVETQLISIFLVRTES